MQRRLPLSLCIIILLCIIALGRAREDSCGPCFVPPPIEPTIVIETATLQEGTNCPVGWTFSPANDVFPATCFRFVATEGIRCSTTGITGAIEAVGVCIFDQRITLRRLVPMGDALKWQCSRDTSGLSKPMERNGAWRCIQTTEPENFEEAVVECPPGSYPACLVITELLTPA